MFAEYNRVMSLFWRCVKLQQIAFAVEEIEPAPARTVDGRGRVNPDTPILHVLLGQFEVVPAYFERLMGRPFPLDKIAIQRRGPLKQHHHAVARAKIGAREPFGHVVAIELCYGHAEDLGVELHRPMFGVLDYVFTDMNTESRLASKIS